MTTAVAAPSRGRKPLSNTAPNWTRGTRRPEPLCSRAARLPRYSRRRAAALLVARSQSPSRLAREAAAPHPGCINLSAGRSHWTIDGVTKASERLPLCCDIGGSPRPASGACRGEAFGSDLPLAAALELGRCCNGRGRSPRFFVTHVQERCRQSEEDEAEKHVLNE